MAKFLPLKHLLAIKRANRKGEYFAVRRRRAKRLKRAEHRYSDSHAAVEHPLTHKKVKTIRCPSKMDLDVNYNETLDVIRDIHKWASGRNVGPVYIDFKPIEEISPSAALMLAAELDRWNRIHPQRKLRAVDVAEWKPRVRRLLYDMGFFKLLSIENKALKWNPATPDGMNTQHKFLPFQVGRGSSGAAASKLRDRVEAFAGRVKRRMSLYDGLVEAMTNVGQHAYPHAAPVKNWWISASIDKANRNLTVSCVDHGRGIPSTLPRKHEESLRELINLLGPGLLKDDAKMIRAAIELERSSTKKRHRGHGLKRDIQRYVEAHDSSAGLKIFSNHGIYFFQRNRHGNESVELTNRSTPFNGTLIEWVIEDYAEQDDDEN